jgi:hypothetical protein
MWPNDRFIKLCGIELPIIQAPMAGSALSDMVVAVSQAGGLGSLAWALLSVEQARKELETTRFPRSPKSGLGDDTWYRTAAKPRPSRFRLQPLRELEPRCLRRGEQESSC